MTLVGPAFLFGGTRDAGSKSNRTADALSIIISIAVSLRGPEVMRSNVQCFFSILVVFPLLITAI